MEKKKRKISGRSLACYESVSAVVLANPGRSMEQWADKCSMDVASLKRLMSRPEFQKILIERRERVCGEIIKEAQIANHNLHLKAIERVDELLPSMQDFNVIKLIDVTGKNTGLQKDKAPVVAVQNNFVVKWLDDDKTVSTQ